MTANNPFPSKGTAESKMLMNAALGLEPSDMVIADARVINVYTGEILDHLTVGVKGSWIAYVGEAMKSLIGPDTEVIDAGGAVLSPGFIDGHTHLAWLISPEEFLKHAIAGGTTTIVTETLEPYPVSGLEGVVDFLESLEDQPIKILSTAPAMVSISRAVRGISMDSLKQLLAREDIVGLGESYWQGVLQEPDRFIPILQETLAAGKILEGHSAGARRSRLNAYVGAGISSCHEPIDAGQVLEKLRIGLHVMAREGSIRRDLEKIAEIRNAGVDLRRLTLVSDGVTPGDLLEKGYMEFIVQKAIDFGFDPVSAIQMATLNVAEHFSLDNLIGGIAPGRCADMAIFPDIRDIRAQYVISNGRVIARDGELMVKPRPHQFSDASMSSIRMAKKLAPSDFVIPVEGDVDLVSVRVINMVTDLVTAETIVEAPVVDGRIEANVTNDILKVAAFDRTNETGASFVGLISGFSMTGGAIACSASWDAADIIVVGADDEDMAAAVNRIIDLQGGAAVCSNGEILAEIAMPVFGLMSQWPMEKIASRLESVEKAASGLGAIFPDPLLSLITLTGAAIPFLRICSEGLVSLKDGKNLSLFVKQINPK